MRILLLILGLALSACASTGGNFPSLAPRPGEIPRVIEEPGADAAPQLLPEQQANLRADLKREAADLAKTESELKRLGAEVDRAVAAARGKGSGSEAWSNAQMALSRFDQARGPLDAIGARLVPLSRQVDGLLDTDADRLAVEALVARAAQASDQAEARVRAANRALGN